MSEIIFWEGLTGAIGTAAHEGKRLSKEFWEGRERVVTICSEMGCTDEELRGICELSPAILPPDSMYTNDNILKIGEDEYPSRVVFVFLVIQCVQEIRTKIVEALARLELDTRALLDEVAMQSKYIDCAGKKSMSLRGELQEIRAARTKAESELSTLETRLQEAEQNVRQGNLAVAAQPGFHGKKVNQRQQRAFLEQIGSEIASLRRQIEKFRNRESARQTAVGEADQRRSALADELAGKREQVHEQLRNALSSYVQSAQAVRWETIFEAMKEGQYNKEMSAYKENLRDALRESHEREQERHQELVIPQVLEDWKPMPEALMKVLGIKSKELHSLSRDALNGSINGRIVTLIESALRKEIECMEKRWRSLGPEELPSRLKIYVKSARSCMRIAENGSWNGKRLTGGERNTLYAFALFSAVVEKRLPAFSEKQPISAPPPAPAPRAGGEPSATPRRAGFPPT